MEQGPLAMEARPRRRSSFPQLQLPQTVVQQPIPDEILQACGHAAQKLGGPRISTLGVTSSVAGEGRTSIAVAMALVHAREYGRPTLLLDTSFERPSLARRFQLPEGPGLAGVISGKVSVEDALHPVGEGLTVMPAGEITDSRGRLATEFVASNLLNELREDFKVVVADLPAVLESTYGARLASLFDRPLLVVRARVTPASTVRKAISQLEAQPAILLNGTYSRLPGRLQRFFI
jgi:protein-tyrosine kinase